MMKICFVRHGEPDSRTGELTPRGHKQAAAAAERLMHYGIESVYASTLCRAQQTAQYTADKLGVDILPCEFIREISWESLDGEPLPAGGEPWRQADLLVSEGKSLFMADWQNHYPYNNSKVVERVAQVAEGVDEWLLQLGYRREGDYYRVVGENTNKTVAMFSHAGSSSAALSHMVNIPFPHFCGAFRPEHTSITVVYLSDEVGTLTYPCICLFNDEKHKEGI
ncbi:MAG: histidine phosphatase family protein [Clostridia bacterium]|nr:histidine phosphatase family protein [Clostridia bacterium]